MRIGILLVLSLIGDAVYQIAGYPPTDWKPYLHVMIWPMLIALIQDLREVFRK